MHKNLVGKCWQTLFPLADMLAERGHFSQNKKVISTTVRGHIYWKSTFIS